MPDNSSDSALWRRSYARQLLRFSSRAEELWQTTLPIQQSGGGVAAGNSSDSAVWSLAEELCQTISSVQPSMRPFHAPISEDSIGNKSKKKACAHR